MMDHNQPTPSGNPERQQEPGTIQGSPWQESGISGASQSGGMSSDLQGAGGEVRKQAGRVAGEARQGMKEVASLAAEKSAMAGQKIREYGSRAFSEQKERAAEEIGGVSSAVRRAADKLHEERDENLAEYVEAAAEQLDRVERYLRTRPLDGMYSDLQGVARRRPEMLVGGMFVAGVALARFLKAGRPEQPSSSMGRLYPRQDIAAGPLVSPRGEPLSPSLYPPPGTASNLERTDIIITPEVE